MITMLMRSPVHPSLMRWALRPEPAGRRRLILAYLTAAAGSLAGLIIFGITLLVSRHCQLSGSAGPGCLATFFRGFGLSIIVGAIVTVGVSIIVKLGLRYVLSLLAVTAPVLCSTQLLSLTGVESRPYALIALVAVPAVAAWISRRLLRGPQPRIPSRAEIRTTQVVESSPAAVHRSSVGPGSGAVPQLKL